MTKLAGPIAPTTQLQKIAGFSCDAHLKYRIGDPQKFFGIAADMVGVCRSLRWYEVDCARALQMYCRSSGSSRRHVYCSLSVVLHHPFVIVGQCVHVVLKAQES